MTDITERLRAFVVELSKTGFLQTPIGANICIDATAEIEKLRADLASIRSVYDFAALEAKIAELRTALKPFADAAEVFNTWCDGSTYPLAIEHAEGDAGLITLGDLRRAGAALGHEQKAGEK